MNQYDALPMASCSLSGPGTACLSALSGTTGMAARLSGTKWQCTPAPACSAAQPGLQLSLPGTLSSCRPLAIITANCSATNRAG